MANWIDLLSLIATLAVVGGVIYGVLFISKQITDGVQSTKESLKSRGLHISDKGVSVKTAKRFDREDYVDATQRGFVKAMGAASFGKADNTSSPGAIQRQDSSASVKSTSSEEKKKRSLFKRSTTGSKEKI